MSIGEGFIRSDKGSLENINIMQAPFLVNECLHPVTSIDDYLWIAITDGGMYRCKVENYKLIIVEHFLQNKSVSRVFRDNDKGYWFLTLKEGGIYLPNDKIKYQKNEDFFIKEVERRTL